MRRHDVSGPEDCARRMLALIPDLRKWITRRVESAGAGAGLSFRQFAALQGIRHGACSPGEIARLWQVTPAVITGIIDRLERRGLVRREPDPDDRRRLRLVMTEAGRAASEEVEQALTGELAARLATATPHELAELGRSLDLLQRTLVSLVERTPTTAGCVGEAIPGWESSDTTEEEQWNERQPETRLTGLSVAPR
jgi:DNA-binding MarR family transcriptional regulator